MATSRTGTSTYLRNAKRVKAQARADGLTHCPGYEGHPCGVELDYDVPLLDNSAETDHIIEWSQGGTDDVDNLRVLCRKQNLERNRTKPAIDVPDAADFPVSRDWFAVEGWGGSPRATRRPPPSA